MSVEHAGGPSGPPSASSPWASATTPDGRRYWYHTQSMETTWVDPARSAAKNESSEEDVPSEQPQKEGVLAGSSAAMDGCVSVGDELLSVQSSFDPSPVVIKNLPEAVGLLFGRPGTKIVLELRSRVNGSVSKVSLDRFESLGETFDVESSRAAGQEAEFVIGDMETKLAASRERRRSLAQSSKQAEVQQLRLWNERPSRDVHAQHLSSQSVLGTVQASLNEVTAQCDWLKAQMESMQRTWEADKRRLKEQARVMQDELSEVKDMWIRESTLRQRSEHRERIIMDRVGTLAHQLTGRISKESSARVALERAVEALQRGLPPDGDSSVAGGSNAATPVAAWRMEAGKLETPTSASDSVVVSRLQSTAVNLMREKQSMYCMRRAFNSLVDNASQPPGSPASISRALATELRANASAGEEHAANQLRQFQRQHEAQLAYIFVWTNNKRVQQRYFNFWSKWHRIRKTIVTSIYRADRLEERRSGQRVRNTFSGWKQISNSSSS